MSRKIVSYQWLVVSVMVDFWLSILIILKLKLQFNFLGLKKEFTSRIKLEILNKTSPDVKCGR